MEEKLTQIKQDTMMFFDGHQEVFPIYESFENMLLHLYPQTKMKINESTNSTPAVAYKEYFNHSILLIYDHFSETFIIVWTIPQAADSCT